MFKQTLIATIATASLLLAAQASAYQHSSSITISVQSDHGGYNKGKSKNRFSKKAANAINKEQREQAVMIQQGIKTCQITPREAATLNTQQSNINKLERRLSKNGLTKWEFSKLNSSLHTARVQINTLTKNRTTCGKGYGKSKKSKRHHGKHYSTNRYNHYNSHR